MCQDDRVRLGVPPAKDEQEPAAPVAGTGLAKAIMACPCSREDWPDWDHVDCQQCGGTRIVERTADEARVLLARIADDFEYLERSYGKSLWTTGGGYVLLPRVLEIRQYLGRPLETPEMAAAGQRKLPSREEVL